MRLACAAWDEAEDPTMTWVAGVHVSSQAPALAAALLGDVESEGAQGGVSLSPAAVASIVGALAVATARPSSTGSYIWCALPPCRLHVAYLMLSTRRALHCGRPLLHALSRVCISDSNKPHVVPEGDTRVLDACAAVLGWGTPGCTVDGGGGRWSPIMVRRIW